MGHLQADILNWQGRFPRLDLATLRTKIETAREEMARGGHEAKQLARAFEEHVGQFCLGLARQPYPVHALAGNDS
jgi:hypothetical protein